MRREYKLAADPIVTNHGTIRREILKFTDEGKLADDGCVDVLVVETILVVANDDALDVLEAIRRAYQDGREDNAAMLEAEGRLRHPEAFPVSSEEKQR